ncbi:competence/damage-inducible protein A [Haloflavibacter putidus]|uniref:CinA-like protein n=1 Tax=Haloflavibacter putidus TaxID=2576776 RepID=A0A507ZEU5_9FLAO|nr:competence/damage-inducible protein A [Haloflavibacter putidus]TQD35457.1 competence/damage-inducible protein A [Haloflavibacter putidus]
MQAEIITIGDEILIGQIVDTNSAFIATELNKIGVEVQQITSISDQAEQIISSLEEARKRSEIVIITGGLGPTNDDITKHTLTAYFKDELIKHPKIERHIEELFEKHIQTPISNLNRQQALLPSKAIALHNAYGTAPGMWIEENNTVFISLPGVPYEMKALLQKEVLPKITDRFNRPFILHKTVLTYGLGESAIAQKIESWEKNLPSFIKLAYLPNVGKVRLRLSARGPEEEVLQQELEKQIKDLHTYIGDIIKGYEEEASIEEQIGNKLTTLQQSIATAESCTGGRLAAKFSAIPGSSNYFRGGFVTYATQSKTQILGISPEFIKKHSVVSAAITKKMAERAKTILNTDFAIATTGNAGPTKGDSDAEIGTVYIAIATPLETKEYAFNFGQPREKVTQKAVNKSLELLYDILIK